MEPRVADARASPAGPLPRGDRALEASSDDSLERLTALVYGDSFALYGPADFEAFLEPLHRQLEANGISTSVFAGQRCLDAGCGGGRGSVLMAEAGAREVVGVDFSARNIDGCRKRAAERGLAQASFMEASLLELPFDDASFDVVWCNGVLHHTADPDRALREITRVLRPDGRLWLYLYGSGGIYWRMLDWVRERLRRVDVRDCIFQLRLLGADVRRIAEWVDDWFTGYLRRYTDADVRARLAELGYAETERLPQGVAYDTSQRRVGAGAAERAFLGEGELRYFCRRARVGEGDARRLPDPPDGRGSAYRDGPEVTRLDEPLARLARAMDLLDQVARHPRETERLLVCRSVHSRVRALLESAAPLDASALERHLRELEELLRAQIACLRGA